MTVHTQQFDYPLFKGKVSVNTGLFIDGKYVDPLDRHDIEVFDPTTGKVITTIAAGGKKDVDRAVVAAQKAFKTTWGKTVSGTQRGHLIRKLAEVFEKHQDELAALETLDSGKQYFHVKAMDFANAIETLKYYAGWADKISGKTIEAEPHKFVYTLHEPIGVVGCIVPWNFPIMILAWKLGPALATGNCVIVKPSEVTPLATLKFAELIQEAGFPPGVVNIVTGYGSVAGQALAQHPDVGKISFTGSTLTGRKILHSSGDSNLKRVTLELGGKTPNIIFDDADIEQAVKWTAMGIFHHAGQMCTAGSRIFVQEGVYDKVMAAFVEIAKAAKPGSGFDPNTKIDPVVSKTQFDRVMGYINAGKESGATVAVGGGQLGNEGYFVQPTLFTDVSADMKIVKEEIFGPVGVIIKFKTEEEALAAANDTTYGLSACIYTKDVERATRFASALEAGSIFVNITSGPDWRVSFGGFKQSGFGKDLGEYALEGYTNTKAVTLNIGQKL
ncbi:aldehyde dehydrogenase [Phanerochaete sordida]|uniref:Aldehyde dehydrogenase n=1 Tax=Phanerochaete sordida TaxID=48140 RepID=A0A9P3G0Z0_9APHY|nr:aldehyde dehydrogenase [Phanerochaete sordida]